MIRSFFLLGFRNLFHKNRYFTLINIGGLAIGLTCVLLVSLFIYDEYTFDRFHKNSNRIYRIVLDFTSEEGNTVNWARTSAPIGLYLQGAYPEIESVVRLRKNPGTDLLSNNEIKFYEEKIFFADSSYSHVFDLPLKRGNPSLALKEKNSIVVTEALGRKYFGNEDPIGKTLRFNSKIDLKITGTMEEMPANSHFRADAFITFSSLDDLMDPKRLAHWGWMDHHTYILLTNGATPEQVEAKFPDFIKKNAPEWVSKNEKLSLQSLASIHLHSDRKDEVTPNSRESYSYILGTIALFILLMACANFINLSTATQMSRFKEISIQKMLGAGRFFMSLYFQIESLIICFGALLLALLLAFLALPYFNLITGKQILFGHNLWMVVPALTLTLFIGFITSIVPSFQASRVNMLQSVKLSVKGKSAIRTALITFQFAISIVLITATWIVSSQFSFLRSSRFGFESDNVITIPVKDRSQNNRHSVLAAELSKQHGVQSVSYCSSTPGGNNAYTYTFTFVGTENGEQTMPTFLVDENFFDLYRIKLRDGRFPNIENKDTLTEVVLNQAAVDQFHLSQPIGQLITGNVKGRVVGVVENFNYESLHSTIEPVIMYSYPSNFRFVSARLTENEIQAGIKSLGKKWSELYPGYPLEYSFLNDQIDQLYSSEQQLTKAYTSFSFMAVVIAGIGLIGLTTYLLTRKLKEISIRKVFGSSPSELITLIYSGYFRVVIISAIIAWSFTYYWMNEWLNGFAFKTEISLFQFAVPTLIMILVLLLATGIQTLRASRTNPVDNLKDE
jgi:putative ABC transport system permease protein